MAGSKSAIVIPPPNTPPSAPSSDKPQR
jgi:hypothetical protein